MALTDDEKSLMEKLQAKMNAPDAEDFEIEIYDTKQGKGTRIPFSHGAKWLFETFGIGDAPAAPEPAGDAGKATGTSGGAPGSVSYFGKAK